MRLLVSVADVEEAAAALAGGADVIDAKDPRAGALGAVQARVLREIRAGIGDARPVTAAIGDGSDEIAVEAIAHEFASGRHLGHNLQLATNNEQHRNQLRSPSY